MPPYSAESFFNLPVDTSHGHASNEAAKVAAIVENNRTARNPFRFRGGADAFKGTYPSGGDWYHPIRYAQKTDPLMECYLYPAEQEANPRPWAWGNGTESIRNADGSGHKIHVPADAKQASGTDGHLTVVQPPDAQGVVWEYDFWQVKSMAPNGRIQASHGGRVRSDGVGYPCAATAGNFSLRSGIITPEELLVAILAYPQYPIKHKLFIVQGGRGTSQWPSTSKKGQTNANALGLGQVAYAARFDDAYINAQPKHLRPVMVCARDYGFIMGDTGGGTMKIDSASAEKWKCIGDECKKQGIVIPESPAGTYSWDLTKLDWTRLRVLGANR